jgi:hypothetical protein
MHVSDLVEGSGRSEQSDKTMRARVAIASDDRRESCALHSAHYEIGGSPAGSVGYQNFRTGCKKKIDLSVDLACRSRHLVADDEFDRHGGQCFHSQSVPGFRLPGEDIVPHVFPVIPESYHTDDRFSHG